MNQAIINPTMPKIAGK